MLSTNLLFLRSDDLNSSRPIIHGGLLSLLLDTFLKTYIVGKYLTKKVQREVYHICEVLLFT